MKIGENDFSEGFIRELVGQIREYIYVSDGEILGVRNTPRVNGVHIGCGTFFQEKKDTFFLTAMHVGRQADKFDFEMHTRNGSISCPFRGVWLGDKDPVKDIAIYGCFSEMIEDSNLSPFDISTLRQGISNNVEGQYFYCQGIPGADTTFLPMMRAIQMASNPVIGVGLPNNAVEYPDRTFSFKYPRNVDPRGMSGSSVWNTNLHLVNSEDEWSIDMLSFAGVVQKWNPANNTIIATRADAVESFIPAGIEKLREMWLNTPNSDYTAPN